jgi:hypothetical protein
MEHDVFSLGQCNLSTYQQILAKAIHSGLRHALAESSLYQGQCLQDRVLLPQHYTTRPLMPNFFSCTLASRTGTTRNYFTADKLKKPGSILFSPRGHCRQPV